MEFVACAMVLFNWHADIGVILLIVFTVVASLLLLRFWEVDVPPMRSACRTAWSPTSRWSAAFCCSCKTCGDRVGRLDPLPPEHSPELKGSSTPSSSRWVSCPTAC